MSWTELLTYTMERHDDSPPCGDLVVSLAKYAPSIDMGERLAADKLIRTGRRSSLEKPQARKSDRAQRSDCAPVSAIADTSPRGAVARCLLPIVDCLRLSRAMVIGTRGWSRRRARLHSHLEKSTA